jgi:hypothetical protein
MKKQLLAFRAYLTATVLTFLSLYLFILPLGILLHDLREPALSTGQIPPFAFRWHQDLSQRYEPWAQQRVASGRATELTVANISGTEWPIFSSVYYLWATEALQAAWDEDPTLSTTMPREYAREAIEAAAALISDPNHAAWVKAHWGDDYLHQENLFYRMLLISGLTTYQKLLADDRYEPLLRDQVESLALELEQSPYGLLDDYPGQCYPIDILPAVAAIQRADEVLGTDHSTFVAQAIRAFEGSLLDSDTGLPAYVADSETGQGIGPARGVGISYMLIWAPELWPDTAENWYSRYENHFWQENWFVAGVREFSRESSYPDWLVDVDAGPVAGSYGTAATAFAIGAARANGRFDHAYPLTAEALVFSWPLPNGTLLAPRLLSNLSDAPYVGEAALLFNLTRQPIITETGGQTDGRLPFIVYLGLSFYAVVGMIVIVSAVTILRRWRRGSAKGRS